MEEGAGLPSITRSFALPVIGNDPYVIDGPKQSPVHYGVWSLIYLSAVLPVVLVWAVQGDDQARWFWFYSSAGHCVLAAVVTTLTAFGLVNPFLLI